MIFIRSTGLDFPSKRFDFCASYELQRNWERFNEILEALDWDSLTFLLHSTQFHEQAPCFDDQCWDSFLAKMKPRIATIKSAAYDCFPEWRATFTEALPAKVKLLARDKFPSSFNQKNRYLYRANDEKGTLDQLTRIANMSTSTTAAPALIKTTRSQTTTKVQSSPPC